MTSKKSHKRRGWPHPSCAPAPVPLTFSRKVCFSLWRKKSKRMSAFCTVCFFHAAFCDAFGDKCDHGSRTSWTSNIPAVHQKHHDFAVLSLILTAAFSFYLWARLTLDLNLKTARANLEFVSHLRLYKSLCDRKPLFQIFHASNYTVTEQRRSLLQLKWKVQENI